MSGATTTDPASSGVLGLGVLGSFTLGSALVSSTTTTTTTTASSSFTFSPGVQIAGTQTAFAPTSTSVFQFQATLDGDLYNVSIPWNISRRGWYFQIYDQSNALIATGPLVGSPLPPSAGVNLVGGYFTTSTLYFYPAGQIFAVAP